IRIRRQAAEGWHVADLTSDSDVAHLPSFSAVVHCAGLTPRSTDLSWSSFVSMNVDVTRRLVQAAIDRGARRFVFISTLGRSHRSRQTRVGRCYVASKHMAEREAVRVARGRMAVWSIRAASMYGEGDRGSMARLIKAVARRRFVLPGSGS